jgi:carbon storage regulator
MIVFSRKKNESIVVSGTDDTEVIISIVEIRDDKVRIGVVAPREMAVHRSEFHQTPQGESHQKASQSIINTLRAELRQSKKDMERYRSLLAQLAAEPWRDVTSEQLKQEASEAKGIQDILLSLDQASAA